MAYLKFDVEGEIFYLHNPILSDGKRFVISISDDSGAIMAIPEKMQGAYAESIARRMYQCLRQIGINQKEKRVCLVRKDTLYIDRYVVGDVLKYCHIGSLNIVRPFPVIIYHSECIKVTERPLTDSERIYGEK